MLFSTETGSIVQKLGVRDGVRALMDAGFPALDMSFFLSLPDFYNAPDATALAKELRAEADARGVIFNQAHAPFYYKDTLTENCSPRFPRVFEFAAILGVKSIVVHPIETRLYQGREKENFEKNVAYYSSLAPLAKANGLRIAIENMWTVHPKQSKRIADCVCSDPAEMIRYYDTLNDPDTFTLCLDVGHAAICNREPQDVIRTLGGTRLGALHVHDVDYLDDLHTLPGLSKLNFDAICRALAEVDYKGEFTLEADAFLRDLPNEVLPTAARLMADVARHWADRIEEYKREKENTI